MTEAEWLRSMSPREMVLALEGRAGARSLRLFACACARRSKALRTKSLVLTAERYADGLASAEELAGARRAVAEEVAPLLTRENRQSIWGDSDSGEAWVAEAMALPDAWAAARGAVEGIIGAAYYSLDGDEVVWSRYRPADLLREVFGNPFRPVAVEPAWTAWNGGAVPRLARAISDEQAYDRMPILADALEDAGCDNAVILAHCRGGGEHARGCWVIDLLLGKE